MGKSSNGIPKCKLELTAQPLLFASGPPGAPLRGFLNLSFAHCGRQLLHFLLVLGLLILPILVS